MEPALFEWNMFLSEPEPLLSSDSGIDPLPEESAKSDATDKGKMQEQVHRDTLKLSLLSFTCLGSFCQNG
jgi:hypothetical protein